MIYVIEAKKLYKKLLKYKDDPEVNVIIRAYELKVTSRKQWYENYSQFIFKFLCKKENNVK